jgi:hypothetical protein
MMVNDSPANPASRADAGKPAANAKQPAARHSAPLESFLTDLLEGYRRLEQGAGATALDPALVRQRLLELQLAEAAARYGAPAGDRRRPPQLAVIGPTQVGKSTAVNLLVGQDVAGVSPLAGFTVHAQGFWTGPDALAGDWLAELFPGWERLTGDRLSRERSNAFALTAVSGAEIGKMTPRLDNMVIWDTPDFDSLSSHAYRRGVMEVIGLSDAILLVLSKEKYADLSVWSTLRLIAPLNRPMAVLLNKLTSETRDAVPAALRSRLNDLGGRLAEAPVFTLEHTPGLSTANLSQSAPFCALRQQLNTLLASARQSDKAPGVRNLLKQHWPEWSAPIEAESAARRDWRRRVDAALDEFRSVYRRDFLEHPQRYDSFRRVTVELLQLLELPGVAGTLHRVREVITWPARRVLMLGQAWFQRRQLGVSSQVGSEEAVLLDMIERLLQRLEREAARQAESQAAGEPVWKSILARLRDHGSGLREQFGKAIRSHCDDITAEIHVAADRLYETLEKSPALLNSLRAVRATADGAAIILAIKTGGIAPHDLIFAPAMLAVSSMLTQGALGGYMRHGADDLKRRQLQKLSDSLLQSVFAAELYALAQPGPDLSFGVGEERLRDATEALSAWGRTP